MLMGFLQGSNTGSEHVACSTRVQITSAYFAAIITESGKIWACAGTRSGAGTARVRFCIGMLASTEYRRVPASTAQVTSTAEQNPARNRQNFAPRMSKSEGDLRSEHGQYFCGAPMGSCSDTCQVEMRSLESYRGDWIHACLCVCTQVQNPPL